ncbi:MAG: hypothetical protein C0409_08065, partial [Novosphingobium sp.]|nr:hypothetical protein [Novosphingobium sp.]
MTGALRADGPIDDVPLYDEGRPELRLRPAKAWRHFQNLMKDKENTEEVFHIFEALPWRNLRPTAERFLRSERGRALRTN